MVVKRTEMGLNQQKWRLNLQKWRLNERNEGCMVEIVVFCWLLSWFMAPRPCGKHRQTCAKPVGSGETLGMVIYEWCFSTSTLVYRRACTVPPISHRYTMIYISSVIDISYHISLQIITHITYH